MLPAYMTPPVVAVNDGGRRYLIFSNDGYNPTDSASTGPTDTARLMRSFYPFNSALQCVLSTRAKRANTAKLPRVWLGASSPLRELLSAREHGAITATALTALRACRHLLRRVEACPALDEGK